MRVVRATEACVFIFSLVEVQRFEVSGASFDGVYITAVFMDASRREVRCWFERRMTEANVERLQNIIKKH